MACRTSEPISQQAIMNNKPTIDITKVSFNETLSIKSTAKYPSKANIRQTNEKTTKPKAISNTILTIDLIVITPLRHQFLSTYKVPNSNRLLNNRNSQYKKKYL